MMTGKMSPSKTVFPNIKLGDCQESCRIFLNKVPSDSLVGFRAT